MSKQRFTPECKEEALRQIIERGYKVADVAERLGVSAHTLYQWIKAVKPDKSEQQQRELLEVKAEILKLRAQLRRTEEERDILKKPRRTLPENPRKVRLHQPASGRVPGAAHVSDDAGDA